MLVIPKCTDALRERGLIAEYYRETTVHDVIFIGDCEVFSSISPVALWEDYGITSYIRGSPEQRIWQSYYLLEDTLQYETPRVVVFNVLAMKFDKPLSEAYNRLTLDGMRFSLAKIKAVLASMTEEEDLLTYIFPLLRYHSRWSELTADDFAYMFGSGQVSHNGYLMRADVEPVSELPENAPPSNYRFSDVCYGYLDMMTALCQENDIRLILVKAPTLHPYWYDEWDAQIADYAQENGLAYVNFLNAAEEIGLNMDTDTYDGGFHLNVSGAEKLSAYFGGILSDFGLEDHHGDAALCRVWAEKKELYRQEKADQEAEIREYGYLTRFFIDVSEGEP